MAGTLNKGSLVKGTGGSGGGGSASFPTIVTDSGSSLPIDLTGYNEGDTFLNTSDKKIYKVSASGYELNTNASISGSATVDYTTGIASNLGGTYGSYSYVRRQTTLQWKGNLVYDFHFKLNSAPTDDKNYILFLSHGGLSYNPYTQKGFAVYVVNKKIHFCFSYSGTSPIDTEQDKDLFDYELSADTEYYLRITKNGTSFSADLFTNGFDGTKVATHTSTTEDYYQDGSSNYIYYGYGSIRINFSYCDGFSIGDVYLLDSIGEFLKPSSTLSWDSGTDITDKTEYADKTNGTLYLYENDELVKIGGSLTKKVYTISADNTSTLDVSSDFTKIVDVLKNGVEIALTDDYTISSGVITFVTALSTTDKITVKGE